MDNDAGGWRKTWRLEGVVESRKRESGEEAIAAVMAVEGAFVRVWDVEVREEEVLSAVSAIPLLFGGVVRKEIIDLEDVISTVFSRSRRYGSRSLLV